MTAVKCEAELRQDRCPHVLKYIDAETAAQLRTPGQRDYKYYCLKCGRYLKTKNGVLKQ